MANHHSVLLFCYFLRKRIAYGATTLLGSPCFRIILLWRFMHNHDNGIVIRELRFFALVERKSMFRYCFLCWKWIRPWHLIVSNSVNAIHYFLFFGVSKICFLTFFRNYIHACRMRNWILNVMTVLTTEFQLREFTQLKSSYTVNSTMCIWILNVRYTILFNHLLLPSIKE